VDNARNFPGQSRARFWFVFALFVVLMVLAHGGAEVKAALDARAPADMPRHTVTYYRVIFAIWITIILLTAALSFHVFSRAGAANDYWIAFWTFAYLAFLTHLYWTIAGTFHFDWTEIFHSQEGVASDPERVVDHPGPDCSSPRGGDSTSCSRGFSPTASWYGCNAAPSICWRSRCSSAPLCLLRKRALWLTASESSWGSL
jgi:hypothetical protein